MKNKIDAVIVVEGRTDIAFLESFIDAEFVLTNGSDVPRETIEYLNSLSMIKKIIVLTDPDSPGKRIRDILNANISGLYHAYVEKKNSIKKGKVGVAECDKKHILEALSNLMFNDEHPTGNLTMNDMIDLGLAGESKANKNRLIVGAKFHIGYANAKTMLKRINSLNISKVEIMKMLKENSNG